MSSAIQLPAGKGNVFLVANGIEKVVKYLIVVNRAIILLGSITLVDIYLTGTALWFVPVTWYPVIKNITCKVLVHAQFMGT